MYQFSGDTIQPTAFWFLYISNLHSANDKGFIIGNLIIWSIK